MASAMRASCKSLLIPRSEGCPNVRNRSGASLAAAPASYLSLRRKASKSPGLFLPNEQSTIRRSSDAVRAQAAVTGVSPADEKDGQSSIYANPGWVWQFPTKKEDNTAILPKDNSLGFWLLLNVALHYFTLVSQSLVAYTIFMHQDVYLSVTAGQTGLFAVILSEIFLGAAGLGPVLMHEYEGWLIAPYKYPVNGNATPVVEPVNNDRWLRNTAFRSLFVLQTVGLSLMFCGVPFLPAKLSWGIWGAVWAFLLVAPRNPLIPFYVRKGEDKIPVLPITPYVLVFFIAGAICYTAGFAKVTGSWFLAVSTALLNAVAGAWFEGVKAESTFDQRWHTAAAFTLGAVGLVKARYLHEHAVSGYVLHAGWGLWVAFVVSMVALIYFSLPKQPKEAV